MKPYGYYKGMIYYGRLSDGSFMEFPTEEEYLEYLREEEKENDEKRNDR